MSELTHSANTTDESCQSATVRLTPSEYGRMQGEIMELRRQLAEAKRSIEHKYLTNELIPVELLRKTEADRDRLQAENADLRRQLAALDYTFKEVCEARDSIVADRDRLQAELDAAESNHLDVIRVNVEPWMKRVEELQAALDAATKPSKGLEELRAEYSKIEPGLSREGRNLFLVDDLLLRVLRGEFHGQPEKDNGYHDVDEFYPEAKGGDEKCAGASNKACVQTATVCPARDSRATGEQSSDPAFNAPPAAEPQCGPGGRPLCPKCGTEEGVHGGCECGHLKARITSIDDAAEPKAEATDENISPEVHRAMRVFYQAIERRQNAELATLRKRCEELEEQNAANQELVDEYGDAISKHADRLAAAKADAEKNRKDAERWMKLATYPAYIVAKHEYKNGKWSWLVYENAVSHEANTLENALNSASIDAATAAGGE